MPIRNGSETSKRADCQNASDVWTLSDLFFCWSVRANIIDKLKHANAHPRISISFYPRVSHHTSQYLVDKLVSNRSFHRIIQFKSIAFGIWHLEFGIWHLEFGIWHLECWTAWRWSKSIFSWSCSSWTSGVIKWWSRSTVHLTRSYANTSWQRLMTTSSSNAAKKVRFAW